MAHEKLIEKLEVINLAMSGFIDNLKDGYYEKSLREDEDLDEKISSELNELVIEFKKINWNYALKDVKKGNEKNGR